LQIIADNGTGTTITGADQGKTGICRKRYAGTPGRKAMGDDTLQAMKELAARLSALPVDEYLASDEFRRFCREHDLWDTWREYLRLEEDRPDLYGRSVRETAFSLFLSHVFNNRKEEFLYLVAALLADFSKRISAVLPVDELKADLLLLGYPESELDHSLFLLRGRQRVVAGPDETGNTSGKKVP
jgi:hypothetical protein